MLIGIGRTVVGCTPENLPGRLDKVETPGVVISHWVSLGMLLRMVG